MSNLRIQLAQTKRHFEQALALLNESNGPCEDPALRGLWLLKQHALPSTNTIVAIHDDKVVGAVTLFGENPFLLPLEQWANLSSYKENLGGRLAEISAPGFAPGYKDDTNLLLALYHFTVCFGSTYCHYESFLTHAGQDWAGRYSKLLHFEPLNVKEKREGLCLALNPRDSGDYRQQFTKDFQPEFKFPEKKFFLVAHQNIKPEVMNHLFNERTRLFETLNDFELRVLKNIYDYGDYAKTLPKRSTEAAAYKRLPQNRRFPMDCEGYLRGDKGKQVHFVVEDVSKSGLKLRTDELLKPGQVHALTISIGVMKQTEVIARAVWVNEMSQTVGFEISSGDKNWAKLIEYLEKDFLFQAA